MASITEIENLDHFYAASGVDKEEVYKAESTLALTFSKDYHQYLLHYGIASANGHELTGLIESPRLNVTAVTNEEREFNPKAPKDMYVIENVGIDCMVAWQNKTGAVFVSIGVEEPIFAFPSLLEYIKS
jgi:hypothetical protein